MQRIALAVFAVLALLVFAIPAHAQTHTVALAWTPSVVAPSTPPAPVTSVTIYRGTSSGGESKLVNVAVGSLPACPTGTPAGSQCFIDAAVANGTTYFYQVSSTNSVGEGGKSTEISAVIPLPNPTVPPAPTNLTGTVN